jgi:hypothetical protein
MTSPFVEAFEIFGGSTRFLYAGAKYPSAVKWPEYNIYIEAPIDVFAIALSLGFPRPTLSSISLRFAKG